ncbi:MAG: hypothetical protein ABWK05_07690 [Pyrobaculum sp.]
MLLVGRSSDRRSERFLHAALPLIFAAVGYVAVGYSAPVAPLLAFLALILAAMGQYGFYPPFWPIQQGMLTGEARAVGLVNSVGNLGGYLGPYMVGWINQTTGSSYAGLLFLAGSVALSSILILTARRLYGKS